MNEAKRKLEEAEGELVPASEGAGPLLQRDYWGVLDSCEYSCPQIKNLLLERFETFPPDELCRFEREENAEGRPLEIGDRLEVRIRMAARTAVRVVHMNDNSVTLATVEGHPEAGRITFGAYRNEPGDVIFHIRSLARSSSSTHYAGFLAMGEPMQTNTWTDFVDRMAHTVAEGIVGAIHAETQEVEREDEPTAPTFIAEGK